MQRELQVRLLIGRLLYVSRAASKTVPGSKSVRVRAPELRSPCPISCALDILGDKWTLLVVRDLMWLNRRLYSEFSQSPERIPTSILADRLRRLEKAGLVKKEPYQHNPVRYSYRLTAVGRALRPALLSLGVWASQHVEHAGCLPDSWQGPDEEMTDGPEPASAVKTRSATRQTRLGRP